MHISSMSKRAAVVAACVGASAAVGVTPAFATSPGANIFGSGSSLQKIVQQDVWIPTWETTAKDHSTLSNDPTITYTSTSSGAGLAEFGNATNPPGGTPTLDPTQDATADNGATNGFGTPVLDAYVGSDDPPTSSELSSAGTNATGSAATAIDEVTVPVAQAPVAVLFSLPTGVAINSAQVLDISDTTLQNIWNQTVPASSDGVYAANTWGAVLEEIGLHPTASTPSVGQFSDNGTSTGGAQSITLQVRSSPSGTSYTFKGFLALTGDTLYDNFVDDNDDWPVTTTNTGNAGGSNEVADTTATPGSVGYANTADAAGATPAYASTPTTASGGNQIAYGLIQDNEGATGHAFYANPEKGNGSGNANVYIGANVNINGATPNGVGNWNVPLSGSTFVPTGSWGGTQASDPDVYQHGGNETYYPIVAATYDLGWTTYHEADSNLVSEYGGSSTKASEAGKTAASFLLYVVGTGQNNAAQSGHYYAKLPTKIDADAKLAAKAVKQ